MKRRVPRYREAFEARYRAGKRLWEPEEDAMLRARYPGEPSSALANSLRRTLRSVHVRARGMGLRKSAEYLASPHACRLRRGDGVGAAYRFQPGHVPANKGVKRPGWAPGRMRETQFKPGERSGIASRNWRPVGTILTDGEGYQRVKVREAERGEARGFGNPSIWPFLQRHVWEQAHGPIPSGHVIAFRNGNKLDVRLENLECISRRELMARNTLWHSLPRPLAEAVQLLGALNRRIKRGTKQCP